MRGIQFQGTKGEEVMKVKGQTRDWGRQLVRAFLRSERREGRRNEVTPGTRGGYIYRRKAKQWTGKANSQAVGEE